MDEVLPRKAFSHICGLCGLNKIALRQKVNGTLGYKYWRWCERCDGPMARLLGTRRLG